MKTINILITISLINLLFIVSSVSALTANSQNYSASMFGTGMATAVISSISYNSIILSEAKGTTRNAESIIYTGNIGFFLNTIYHRTVSITSYSISPSSAVVGSTIGLSISALNYQSVWAKITSPNSQQQTLNLINGQTVNYVPSPSVVGIYEVIFYANSSTGAITSIIDYFELTSQTTAPPPGGGSSGGGGTTTIIEKCTYNWDCTPWSVCSDGKQTRTCKNIGSCNGTENKPIEEMPCSESLFDIILKFKEIGLTQNETLRFIVELIEVNSVEKIDVLIRYSIIDKDNNELLSQTETRAVQGNLSYEKEMSEMKLKDGEYTLRVDILYGNLQRASADQKFIIKDREISIEESISILQRINIFVFVAIGIIILLMTIILWYLLTKFKKISTKLNKIERRIRKHKRKYVIFSLITLFAVSLLAIIIKTNITGRVINNLSDYNYDLKWVLAPAIIIIFIALIVMLRKKIFLYFKKIIRFLSGSIKNPNKYPKNSIKGLINKKVYSESGHYLGKIKDVSLEKNKIGRLKIKICKKRKFKTRRISVGYKHVKGAGKIIILDKKVIKKIKKH
ncbi:MAG: PRC-barrel domain-containing protein [archaeon]